MKRLLAVKKSLAEFEQNVEHVMKVGALNSLWDSLEIIFSYHAIIDSQWNQIENDKLHDEL